MIAAGGIPKPAFGAFDLLHQLGDERLASNDPNVIITRRKDGTLVIALWNLVEPEATGPDKSFHLDLHGVSPHAGVTISRVDADHGDTLAAYDRMGKPRYPTQAQIKELRRVAELGPPKTEKLDHGGLTISVPQKGLALVTVK